MFDPASHNDLKHSPRLREIKEVFKAIATGVSALEVRKMAVRLMHDLNGVERDLLQSQGLVEKELRARDGK
jgi:hypothetical protein